MNYKAIFRVVSYALLLESICMVPGMLLCLLDGEPRVALAYLLAPIPAFGLPAIWWAIPIGWVLADLTGLAYYRQRREMLLPPED